MNWIQQGRREGMSMLMQLNQGWKAMKTKHTWKKHKCGVRSLWKSKANNSHVACMQDIKSPYKILMEMRAAGHFSDQGR
jgi:hypothetical protein